MRFDRGDQQALNGPLQRTGAVLHVRSLAKEKILGVVGGAEHEGVGAGRLEDALLDHVDLDVEHFTQLVLAERLEYYDLVRTVDELRRELAASRFDTAIG